MTRGEDGTPGGRSPGGLGSGTGGDETLAADDAPTGGRAAGTPPATLERGTTLGRYVVLDRLGSGGMGVVYAAYDPELDRKLAVKLLHVETTGSTDARDGRHARLQREAQAMARLSHPNVVTVHDVGTVDGDVFVAMEFIEGETLGQWLERESRTWMEIVRVFVQAGRGLVAAHEAELIHRDFKPDNVMVAQDSRVLVMDFGLARAASEAAQQPRPTISESTDLLASPLTRTGALLGTPAYMAPEQYAGERTDGRTDQFSFCVALYEALYAERPFEGDTFASLAAAVSHGDVRKPPAGSAVPQWLRQVVLRGLEASPAARYPSMAVLLTDLARDPGQRARRWFAVAGMAAFVGAGALALSQHDARTGPTCADSAERLHGVWDADRRAEVSRAFEASGKGFAPAAFEGAARQLDAYATQWTDMHRDTCEATHVRGEQSEELLDLRMACLSRGRAALGAATDLLLAADEQAITHAVKIASGLPPVADCADVERLTARVRPPDDPQVRAEVDAVGESIATLRPLLDSGKYKEALERAQEVFDRASATEHRPLLAEAGYQLGVTQWLNGEPEQAEKTIEAAHFDAAASRDDALAARTAAELVTIVGGDLDRHADGRRWASHAAASIERMDEDPLQNARLANNLGTVLESEGKYDEAREHYERALEVRRREYGERDVGVANALNNIALVHEISGKYEDAVRYHQQALEIREAAGGPGHPEVGDSHNNLGLATQSLGRYEESRKHLEKALEIWRTALGEDHLTLASGYNNLGATLDALGRGEEALDSYGKALAIRERVLPPDHALIASALKNLGHGLAMKGDNAGAREHLDRALKIQEKTLGPEHAYVSEVLIRLGDLDRDEGNLQLARARYERAVSILDKAFPKGHGMTALAVYSLGKVAEDERDFAAAAKGYVRGAEISEQHLGPTHPQVAHCLRRLGLLHVRRKQDEKALTRLERALSIYEDREETGKATLGSTRFGLARALWRADRDRQRARSLAEQAKADYESAGEDHAGALEEVARWLNKHAD